jgi:hypothetical protein
MPTHPHGDVLRELRDEWRRLGRSPEARKSVELLRSDPGVVLPHGVVDLDGIVTILEPRGGLTQLERAELVSVLLARAQDPLIRRCLLQTLLPGIVSVARQLQFGAGIADSARSFLADAITEAVELLDTWAGRRRAYAGPDLLNALRCRVRRRMLADKRRRMELVGDDARLDRPVHDVRDELVRALRVAAEHDVTDVDLLYARTVLGYSTSELAHAVGVTSGVLHRRLVAASRPYVASS